MSDLESIELKEETETSQQIDAQTNEHLKQSSQSGHSAAETTEQASSATLPGTDAVMIEPENSSSTESVANQGYFDAEAIAVEEQDSSAMPSPPERSIASPQSVPSLTIVDQAATKADSSETVTSTPKRSTAGWNMKGWLRSASSSSGSGLRLEPQRKSVISSTSTESSLTDALNQLRASQESQDEIDWSIYERLLQTERPISSPEFTSLLLGGMPAPLRGLVWQAMTGSKNTELEAVYSALLGEKGSFENQIKKDVQRMSRAWLKSSD